MLDARLRGHDEKKSTVILGLVPRIHFPLR
jgi:hypothetical protein